MGEYYEMWRRHINSRGFIAGEVAAANALEIVIMQNEEIIALLKKIVANTERVVP